MLYNAASLIFKRLETISDATQEQQPVNIGTTVDIKLYQLDHVIHLDYKTKLSRAVNQISGQVQFVEAIFCMGATPDQQTFYLLILVADDQPEQAQTLACRIEDLCRDVLPVVALVHYVGKLHSSVAHGNAFFCRALSCPLLYLSGNLILPVVRPVINTIQAGLRWERWHRQSLEFLAGAEFYINQKAYGTALFSLHQCTEGLMTAIIRGIMNYDIKSRNLSRLLMLTQMFTYDLVDIFRLDSDEGKQRFDCLKSAYIDARFKDVYEPDSKTVTDLYRLVKELTVTAGKIYHKYLLSHSL